MTPSVALTKMAREMRATQSCTRTIAMRLHPSKMDGAVDAAGMHCFEVTLNNITRPDEFTASNGTKWTLGFSPGSFVVTSGAQPYFKIGAPDRRHGLRSEAEEGDPSMLTAYVSPLFSGSGAFLVPVGGSKPKGIAPGESYEFFVAARPGERLYFTTMMGQSNDWFYSVPRGIALFDGRGKPRGGDVTANVALYDAGTEADEEAGIGPSQGPREPHPRFGPDDPNSIVRVVTTDARFVDPTKHMRLVVTPQ